MDLTEIRKRALSLISEDRIPHVTGVASECRRIASLLGLDAQAADELEAAGWLHDITKKKSPQMQLALLETAKVTPDADSVASPRTLHQTSGAVFAKGLFPKDVTNRMYLAIAYHCTGRADMTLFEKILYIADYIEPSRQYDECIALRDEFNEKIASGEAPENVLDTVLLHAFDTTVVQLAEEGKMIHRFTYEAREFLKKQLGK